MARVIFLPCRLHALTQPRTQVVAGLRPAIPAACPPAIAALMQQCWAAEPRDRPSVPELIRQLTRLLLQFRASAADALIVDAAASARF